MRRAMLTSTALVSLLLWGGATRAGAQSNSEKEETRPGLQKVTFRYEGDIREALKTLFASQNINYTIGPDVKESHISVSISDTPFRIVLEKLLKASGQPLTWSLNDNVFEIAPIVEGGCPGEPPRTAVQIRLKYAQAGDVVRRLRTLTYFTRQPELTLEARRESNSVLISGPDDIGVNEASVEVEALDMPAPQIEIVAEAVLRVQSKTGRAQRPLFRTVARTLDQKPIRLKLRSDTGNEELSGALLELRITPSANRDNTLMLDISGMAEVVWRVSKGKINHWKQDFTGSERVRSGSVFVCTQTRLPSNSASPASAGAELIVTLTPRAIYPAGTKSVQTPRLPEKILPVNEGVNP